MPRHVSDLVPLGIAAMPFPLIHLCWPPAHCSKEQLALLQSRLDEKSYDVLNASGDALNLSMEMSEADL